MRKSGWHDAMTSTGKHYIHDKNDSIWLKVKKEDPGRFSEALTEGWMTVRIGDDCIWAEQICVYMDKGSRYFGEGVIRMVGPGNEFYDG